MRNAAAKNIVKNNPENISRFLHLVPGLVSPLKGVGNEIRVPSAMIQAA